MNSKQLSVNDLLKSAQKLTDEEKLELVNNINIKVRLDWEKEILLTVKSNMELKTRSNSCKKEPETIEWLTDNLSDNDVFYDVGANVGAYSMVAASINNNIKVYAFEPGYATFCDLVENVQINNMEHIINPVNIALTNITQISEFNYSSVEAGAAAHAFGDAIDQNGNKFKPALSLLVSGYSVDDIAKFISPPTIIKIDVDGIEDKVLLGALSTLKNCEVRTLLVEGIEGSDLTNKIKSILDNVGFYVESSHLYTYGISGTTNYIFKRK